MTHNNNRCVRLFIKAGLIGAVALTTVTACSDKALVKPSTADKQLKVCPATTDSASGCKDGRLLHVASPDWRDQIIYFLLLDRFDDGDPSNNDQGAGVYDPEKGNYYSGGDIRGVINNIDYIKELGATAVWTTPQVANLWWDPLASNAGYAGYHGYWARDFKSVDEHYGTLDDYKDLAHALHSNGMYLMQDIVVNHVGNYSTYQGPYNPEDPTENIYRNIDALPSATPDQYPFNLNDVNNSSHRDAAIYHWTPEILDFEDPHQEIYYQSSDLDDLNTQNSVVREVLKESYAFWIEEAGVDAFRVDTAKYVESEFYEDFIHSPNGIKAVAKQTGRDNFYTVAEVNNTSLPFSDEGERKIAQYLSTVEKHRLQAGLGYPLYKDIHRVFGGGESASLLSYRIKKQMEVYSDPFLTANFINNHDVKRFLSSGDIDSFRQAIAFIMTIPGIPVIYQGDEQGILEVRRAMFPGGYLNEKSQFNRQSEMYRYVQELTGIRKSHKIFSRGAIEIIQANPSGPGVLAYERQYKDQLAYVIFNTAKNPVLLNALQTQFSDDTKPKLLASQNMRDRFDFSENGTLTLELPPKSFLVLIGDADKEKQLRAKQASSSPIKIANIQSTYVEQNAAVISGYVKYPGAKLLRVIDGNLERAKSISADDKGYWTVDLPVADLGEHEHFVEIYAPQLKTASSPHSYRTVRHNAQLESSVSDKLGDDTGYNGAYIKPQHSTFGCNMDIDSVTAKASGSVLKLSMKMCEIGSAWAAPSGFDRVSFSIFFDHPGRKGASTLPLLNSRFPDGSDWDFAHVAYGWGSYMYSSKGASADQQGDIMGVSPPYQVNPESREVTFTYVGSDFGVENWENTTVYMTTWDMDIDGEYRRLSSTPSHWTFAVKDLSDPVILDSALLTLTANPN